MPANQRHEPILEKLRRAVTYRIVDRGRPGIPDHGDADGNPAFPIYAQYPLGSLFLYTRVPVGRHPLGKLLGRIIAAVKKECVNLCARLGNHGLQGPCNVVQPIALFVQYIRVVSSHHNASLTLAVHTIALYFVADLGGWPRGIRRLSASAIPRLVRRTRRTAPSRPAPVSSTGRTAGAEPTELPSRDSRRKPGRQSLPLARTSMSVRVAPGLTRSGASPPASPARRRPRPTRGRRTGSPRAPASPRPRAGGGPTGPTGV